MSNPKILTIHFGRIIISPIEKGDENMLMFYMAMIDDEVDQLRFERIYYSYRKQMLLVADRVLHNMSEAEDAVQDALLRIARNIANVPKDEKVERAYVLTAAKNAALNLLPKQQQRQGMLNIADVNAAADDNLFRRCKTAAITSC